MSTPVLSLLPVEVDIEVVQATDNWIEFQLKGKNGQAEVITSDTVKFTAKTAIGGTVKISLSNAPGAHQDPAAGTTRFHLSKTDLVTDDPTSQDSWVYEVCRVFGGTNEEVDYIKGELRLMPRIGT